MFAIFRESNTKVKILLTGLIKVVLPYMFEKL